MKFIGLAICALALAGLTVSCSDSIVSNTPTGPDESGSALLPASNLTSGCYDWPEVEFSRDNVVEPTVLGEPGDPAVDFTLRDINGRVVHLATLLETRPVLLVLGSFT